MADARVWKGEKIEQRGFEPGGNRATVGAVLQSDADIKTLRDLGRLLAALRRAGRLTQQSLAQRIGYGRSTIANVETGRQNAPQDFWLRCDNALAAQGQLVEAYDRTDQVIRLRTIDNAKRVAADICAAKPTWGEMLRRSVLKGVAALPLLAASDSSSLPSRFTDTPLDELVSICEVWRRSYQSMPTSALLRAAHGHLDVAVQLATGSPSVKRSRILADCVGQMATLTGILLGLDGGRRGLAKRYFDLAWRVSSRLGDPEMQAVCLGSRAFLASFSGREHDALELANRARRIAGCGASSTTRGWVAAIASERYASLGDMSRSLRCLEEAHGALATPNEARWLGIGSFDSAKLAAYEGGNLARLGQSRAAVAPLTRAIDRLQPTTQRHLATAYIDRAEAYQASGEFEGAAIDADTALGYVVETGHSANFARLIKLAKYMRRSTAPTATTFVENLTAAIAAQTQRMELSL